MTFKTKIKDSVKDNKDVLDEDNKKDNSKDTPKVNYLTLNDNKINDNNTEHKRIRHTTEEKREKKFNTIDWTKNSSEVKKENEYDRIDWKTDTSEENKVTKWDKIDWNKQDEKVEEHKYENEKDKLMNKEKDEKFREEIEFKDIKTPEIPKDQKEQLKLEKEYNNLIDPQIQEAFKAYKQETGVDPNFGGILRSKFMNWIHTNFKENVEIVKKIDNIAQNHEISNFLTKSIQNTNLTQKEIAKLMNDINIPISRETIGNFSRKLKNNLDDFENQKKFSEFKDSKYKNLLNPELNNLFAEYKKCTGNYPNRGAELTSPFLIWVKNNPQFNHLLEDVNSLRNNNEIAKYLKHIIKNSRDSMASISNHIKDIGIYVERHSVNKFALEEVYNNDILLYNDRLNRLPNELKNQILIRLENESKKTTPDSIYKITQDFQVSKSYIQNLAKNKFEQDLYEKLWPTTGNVSNKTKEKIVKALNLEAKREYPRSLRDIAKDYHDASHTYVMELAKKLYPEIYDIKWPAIEKIPKEIKEKIVNTIKKEAKETNPRTLREIHKQFSEVGADTIKRLAKLVVPPEMHKTIWPPLTEEISKNTINKINQIAKEEIKKLNPKSLRSISKSLDISFQTLCKIVKHTIPKDIYERTWPAPKEVSKDIKRLIVKDIKTRLDLNAREIAKLRGVSEPTVHEISLNRVFIDNLDDHKKRFPNDHNIEIGSLVHQNINALVTKTIREVSGQTYYSEPTIFPDRRRPDGVILEDKNYLYSRLKFNQSLVSELNIDKNILESIKATQFDYTNDLSTENILNKITKYQSTDTLLFIVGTRWYNFDNTIEIPESEDVKYPNNIRIMNYDLFSDLIGLDGLNREIFSKIIELNYDHDLDSLRALYFFNLSSIDTYDAENLKNHLLEQNLINENLNEYFSNFEVRGKKDKNKKQLKLDVFLID